MTRRALSAIRPVFALIALTYYRAALKQMGGDHPDAGDVVLKINELETK